MLKLTLKPGEYIDIGEDVRVVFSGGSANNIHLLVDAPKEVPIARSNAGANREKAHYYKEKGISAEAQREIASIIMREKNQQVHESDDPLKRYGATVKTGKRYYTNHDPGTKARRA